MAKLAILVLFCFTNVYANYCDFDVKTVTCDQCVRCGNNWCSNIQETNHCTSEISDDWCPDFIEQLPQIPVENEKGTNLSPSYAERTIFLLKQNNIITFNYILKEPPMTKGGRNPVPKAFLTILNSTQNFATGLENVTEVICTKADCTINVEVSPLLGFCSEGSTTSEFVFVKLNVDSEEAVIKYHVPCACECSKRVEIKSHRCFNNGDLTCGRCNCYKGWKGQFCNEVVCEELFPDSSSRQRGDVSCNNPVIEGDCSGNGYCSACDQCICYMDREGSQYFEAPYCADLCMVTNECETCLRNGSLGHCDNCGRSLTLYQYNETTAAAVDEYKRRVWVRCNETIDDCYVEYVAMKDMDGEIHAMIVKHCNQIEGAAGYAATTKVPIIVAVIGIVAAIATVAGVMLWKHMTAVPPLPLSDPQYQNIDAEDAVGENPLYRPPTSSFKNPTYGKW